MDPLSEALQLLESMKTVYLRPLRESVCPKAAKGKFIFTKFKQTYYAMVSASIFTTRFLELFKGFFTENSSASLGIRQKRADDSDDAMEIDSMSQIEAATSRTFDIIISADEVGLGGAQAQRIFAGVMSELLTKHVTTTYAREWTSPSTIPERLRTWVRETFAKYIAEVLYNLRGDIDTDGDGEAASMVTQADISNWQQRAISDLGTLRLKELFDVVVEWDDGSRGAIEDLKQYISTTSARAHLVSYFSGVISQRLLHPGASTTQILQIYVCIIRAFAVLDPRGVLLDRLARPIRRYLRDRDDTVKIIVGGLLADPEDENPSPDALVELSLELNKITEISSEDDDGDLDWDDMNWMPNPVDADVEFKKSKSSDVAGTLISLFESKDIFVKEFQNILGERLLKADLEFDREVRVLELLKIRFGDAPLQACEVMLKDIIGSRRTDARVRKDQNLADQMSAKILSRLFWPSLHTETFNLPPSIQSLQERYEKGFEEFKSSRKLTWMNALGQATVELQLEDRTVHEVVQTWQASVIYAFQSQDGTSVMKTAEQLEEELIMDEDLVQNALTFWVGKLVLVNDPPGSDKYTVLETLPPATSADATSSAKDGSATLAAAAAAASAASMAAAPALKSEDDILEEKMAMIRVYSRRSSECNNGRLW